VHVAVTAVGADRPGIVAAVTKVLFDVGANIEDSRMATLGGHFAMMLIVALPPGISTEYLEEHLGAPADALDLTTSVRPVDDASAARDEGEPYVVSVYGADHPGIVARVSGLLAAAGVNITDLATHVTGEDPPVYVMVMEVTLSPGTEGASLESDLKSLAAELNVDVSMRPMEPDTL
jgi:glycine cleavage system transcriptional repressor